MTFQPKIFDCFMFFNELEVLDIRLKVMSQIVNTFVLVENTKTFSNNQKRLFFNENKSRFSAYNINHIIVEDSPNDTNPWIIEAHQRDCIKRGLLSAKPEDIVLISDVDEIPNPNTLVEALPVLDSLDFFSLKQKTFYYYINCLQKQTWLSPTVSKFKFLDSPQKMRKRRFQHPVGEEGEGGWHYGYLGGAVNISFKIESFSHQELNIDEFKEYNHVKQCIKTGKDLFGRKNEIFTRRFVELDSHSNKQIRPFIKKYPNIYQPLDFDDLEKWGFEGLIRIYFKAHSEFSFIQIGANDGLKGDPLYRFIQELDWTGILVEPQKEVFDAKLQPLYGTNPKIQLENVAVAEENGHMTLYKVAFSNSRWATGLASFKKSHIEKHIDNGYIKRNMKGKEHLLPQSKEDYITSEIVNTVTLQNLISKYKIETLDLLQIDVEGYDYQILKSFDLSVMKPSIIQYEHLHMSTDEQSDLKFHLSKSGYIQFKENINTICITIDKLIEMEVF